MQCGTPVEVSAKPAAGPQVNLKFIKPAVVGGILLGLLSSIPIVQAGFGIWILVGSGLTTHFLLKQRPSGIGYGDGAFGGVLSGFVGAIVATMMLIPIKLNFPSDFQIIHQEVEQQLAKNPEMQGPMRDLILRTWSPEVSFTTEMFSLFLYGIFFSLIAMFGGMLMVWLSNRRRARRRNVQV